MDEKRPSLARELFEKYLQSGVSTASLQAAGPPGRRAAGPPGRRAAGPPGRRSQYFIIVALNLHSTKLLTDVDWFKLLLCIAT